MTPVPLADASICLGHEASGDDHDTANMSQETATQEQHDNDSLCKFNNKEIEEFCDTILMMAQHTTESLKSVEPSSTTTTSRRYITSDDDSKIKNVSFDATVSVCLIASHKDYPLSIKHSLWTNRHELLNNVKRNKKEFEAEGLSWREAVEEQDMIHDPTTGEMIHPVHVKKNKYYVRELPPPSSQVLGGNMLRPKPQRPLHPSILPTADNYKASDDGRYGADYVEFCHPYAWEPILRPSTPCPSLFS